MFLNLKAETRKGCVCQGRGWKRLLVATLIAGVSGPVLAHHSYVMFNRGKVATATGTVAAWNWTNPHISLRMKGARPGQAEILFEGHSPSIYRKAGVNRDVTAVGQKVTLTYHPMANGSPGGQILTINGKGAK